MPLPQRHPLWLVSLAACSSWGPDPNHCLHDDGDRFCREKHPDLPYCTLCPPYPADGCAATRPDDDSCYAPCGGGMFLPEDASCLHDGLSPPGSSSSFSAIGSTDGEGSTTTFGASTLDTTSGAQGSSSTSAAPHPCAGTPDCPDPQAPFCDPGSGRCVPCDGLPDGEGDAACAALDPALPVCFAGACRACSADALGACRGTTPRCDLDTRTCVPCTAHDQCPPEDPAPSGAACNLLTGACLPSANLWHVDGDHTPCPGQGTPDEPFCSLADAIARLDERDAATLIVHALDDDVPYHEALSIGGDRTLALLAASEALPRWSATIAPQLTVTHAATVFLDGLSLESNAQTEALRVEGGTAYVDRVRIVHNVGGGIRVLGGGELFLRTSFVTGGPDGPTAIEAVASSVDVLYATIFASSFDAPRAIACDDASTVSIRNSIAVTEGGDTGTETCAAAITMHSATEENAGPFPDGDLAAWFRGNGDLHLQNDGPTIFSGIALWQPGDPTTDIDGDPRPRGDDPSDVAGADVP